MAYAIDPFLSPSAEPGGFTVSVEPMSVRVVRPGGATAVVSTTVGKTGKASKASKVECGLSFEVSGLPPGVLATFEPPVVDVGSATRLGLAVGAGTPAGLYPLTVVATSAGARWSRAYLSLAVEAGERRPAPPGEVRLSAVGAPPGTGAAFSPTRLPDGGTSAR